MALFRAFRVAFEAFQYISLKVLVEFGLRDLVWEPPGQQSPKRCKKGIEFVSKLGSEGDLEVILEAKIAPKGSQDVQK